jgi:hypothetical protein
MRTPSPLPEPRLPSIPLLDASSLPAEEDWAVLEALQSTGDSFDPDEDRYAGFGVTAGDFD